MDTPNATTVTELLAAAGEGDQAALNRLVQIIYDELRAVAGKLMANERASHTLQPTALVHEAIVRLLESGTLASLANRRSFFAAAATAMRRVLVDHARARRTQMRGGGWKRVPLFDDMLDDFEVNKIDILALNEALDALEHADSRQREFIEQHYFGGRSFEEIAADYELTAERVRQVVRDAEKRLKTRLESEATHDAGTT